MASAIILGGIVLSLAFGLGAKDIYKGYLENKTRAEEPDDIEHL